MGKKLSYKEIRASFEKEGYILLDTVYKGSYIPLKCKCKTCNTVFYKKPTYVRNGDGCKICAGLDIRPFEYVKDYIEEQGYTLLSREDTYINSKSILYVECPEGHVYETHWNRFQQDARCPKCKYILQGINQIGENNSQWKGGIRKLKVPLYETYAHQLKKYQSVHKIEQGDLILLGVECTYCNEIFVPNIKSIEARLASLMGKRPGEANLYCSNKCKDSCATYGQQKYPKGFKPYKDNRWSHTTWANMVKERDNYTCKSCGKKEEVMIAHHIIPVIFCDMLSLDIHNGITLCKVCHKDIHTIPGCTLKDLKTKL